LVLQTVAASMKQRFERAGLILKTEIPPAPMLLLGDERRLQQLFANLLENSLRYTDRGGEVRVSCTEQGSAIRIQIEDSAPGVEQDKLDRIFERFFRAEFSRNRISGGSGLGLAICRNIVEAHEGRIAAKISQLGGLEISVELPVET
jgi:two-component system sensor histidine kinase BaeS